MVRLAMTAAFSFSRLPMHVLGIAGAVVCLGAILSSWYGVPTAAAALYFLGGVQLIGLWVLGQYLATVAEEVRRRPLYLVRETLNLQSRPAREL
jgi:dolichol-phosphate mannosyltransferase